MSKEFEPFIIRGTIVRMGDDENGQPRVIVATTRDELGRFGNLLYTRVSIVPAVEEKNDEQKH